ncbi:unnamed protein product [Rotaria sp. Silwood1]|nr:unnamed protein product [Rotaria sp. Silwood1]CAF1648151.1 unnamed protein product [Rotaria sp. Silwood1]CAF3776493.1 unnamed protein product [Rotaria sp. Silwood1]CAF3955490.1 unnamed protein product [Rotaria sp. Silwood1]CAF4828961.1 unnamed protein product [Rotaria sp. Silwood1]
MICQQHLPFIANQVINLSLFDDDNTPKQIDLFFSYIQSFSQFTYLRTLSLATICSYEILIKVIHECQYLSNHNYFLFYFSCQNCQIDFQFIIDTIWSLPKLIYCRFGLHIDEQQIFCTPTKISSTLKCAHMCGYTLKWNQINQLFECTPCLERLSISITSTDDDDDYRLFPVLTLIDLKVNICHRSNPLKIITLLQNIPNLRCLNVDLLSNLLNGHQWEQIIRNYLPKLKVLRLSMRNILSLNENIEEQVDELINSFRSSFWIDEHKWFVRCFSSQTFINLYSLSERCYYGHEKPSDLWRSTYPHDNQQNFYNDLNIIYDHTFFDQSFPTNIYLYKIKFLFIKFPINNQFWSIVSNLKELSTLIISSYRDTFQTEFQRLLNRAPHLNYLCICQEKSLPLQKSLFNYTNTSIPRLPLENYYLNEEECIELTQSPLIIQCQVLSIQVKSRQSIIILVKNMNNLRRLDIQCENELHDGKTSNKYDLVQWLNDHLSSTYLIFRDSDDTSRIRIWI